MIIIINELLIGNLRCFVKLTFEWVCVCCKWLFRVRVPLHHYLYPSNATSYLQITQFPNTHISHDTWNHLKKNWNICISRVGSDTFRISDPDKNMTTKIVSIFYVLNKLKLTNFSIYYFGNKIFYKSSYFYHLNYSICYLL